MILGADQVLSFDYVAGKLYQIQAILGICLFVCHFTITRYRSQPIYKRITHKATHVWNLSFMPVGPHSNWNVIFIFWLNKSKLY